MGHRKFRACEPVTEESLEDASFQSQLRQQHQYKPLAIRLPSLILFLILFGVCIGAIENLLSNAKSAPPNNTVNETNSIQAQKQVENVSIPSLTVPADGGTPTAPGQAEACALQLDSLEQRWTTLCSTFTSIFGPSPTTSLSPPMQTSFSLWSSLYASVADTKSVIRSSCFYRDDRSDSGVYTVGSVMARITVGCTVRKSPFPYGCRIHVDFGLFSGIITQSFTPYCGVLQSDMMIVETVTGLPIVDFRGLHTTTVSSTIEQAGARVDQRTPGIAVRQASPSTAQMTATSTGVTTPAVTSLHQTSGSMNRSIQSTTWAHSSSPNSTFYVVRTSFSTFIRTTDGSGRSTTFSAIGVKNVTLSSSPTATSSTESPPAPVMSWRPNPDFKISPFELEIQGHFNKLDYFYALFSAPLIAVVIKGFSEVIVASFKLIEPFHHLVNDKGTKAVHSLSMQYLSSSISLDMFRSLKRGHLITIWSTSMFSLLAIVTPLAAASTTVRVKAICEIGGAKSTCEPVWIVNTMYLRAVQVILIICATMVLLLILSTWRYYLNIPSNPSSIVSILGLLNNTPFIKKLQVIEPSASNSTLQTDLECSKFRLGRYYDPGAAAIRLGFLEMNKSVDLSLVSQRDDSQDISPPINGSATTLFAPLLAATTLETRRSRLSLNERNSTRFWDVLHLLCACTLFSLAVAFYFNNRPDSFNAFFNSKKAAPKLLLVSLAAIVDTLMKDLEREIRITEPYRRLSKRYSRPETTILMPLNGTCWSNLPLCLYRLRLRDGHMVWQTTVSCVAALSDFNIIAAAGVPLFDGMTLESYKTCVYGVMCITGLIILVTLMTMLWWRRVPAIRYMPREPNTIASVCSYLCGSQMVNEWSVESVLGARLESLKERERDQMILDTDQTFSFTRKVSVDGKLRWTIDFEKGDSKETGTVC